jgi:hypothetical protein
VKAREDLLTLYDKWVSIRIKDSILDDMSK